MGDFLESDKCIAAKTRSLLLELRGNHLAQYAVLMVFTTMVLFTANGYITRRYAGSLIAFGKGSLGQRFGDGSGGGSDGSASSRSTNTTNVQNRTIVHGGDWSSDWESHSGGIASQAAHERVHSR